MLVFAVWVVSHDVVITIPIEVPRRRPAFVIGPSKPLLNQFRLRPKERHNCIRADAPFMCSKIDLSYPLIGRYLGLSYVHWKPADLLHNSLTVCHDRRIARISGNEKFSVESQIGPGTPEIVRRLLAKNGLPGHVAGTSALPPTTDIRAPMYALVLRSSAPRPCSDITLFGEAQHQSCYITSGPYYRMPRAAAAEATERHWRHWAEEGDLWHKCHTRGRRQAGIGAVAWQSGGWRLTAPLGVWPRLRLGPCFVPCTPVTRAISQEVGTAPAFQAPPWAGAANRLTKSAKHSPVPLRRGFFCLSSLTQHRYPV